MAIHSFFNCGGKKTALSPDCKQATDRLPAKQMHAAWHLCRSARSQFGGKTMNEEREKVRCRHCELANWSDEGRCRRCGEPLPAPLLKVIERVEEKIVIRQDPRCLECLERACNLISVAIERLNQPCVEQKVPIIIGQVPGAETFPTMAEMERSMILAAYERSERKPLLAAQLLGIGKTTFYRKLKEMAQGQMAETTSLKLAA
jgi:hypothetical protein